MKKRSLALLFVGIMFMSLEVLTRSFLSLNGDAADFLKGFGIIFVLAAVFQESHARHTTKGSPKNQL